MAFDGRRALAKGHDFSLCRLRGEIHSGISGGNSGFEEGLFLTRFAKHVTIVEFAPQVKASHILQEKVVSREEMMVATNHAVQEFVVTDGRLSTVKV